jgi:hypothetical protein
MIYRLVVDGHRYEDARRFAMFSVRNINFVEIENQSSCTLLDAFIQILDCSMEKRLCGLQTLLFLRNAFRLNDLIGVTKNNQMYQAPSVWSLE